MEVVIWETGTKNHHSWSMNESAKERNSVENIEMA